MAFDRRTLVLPDGTHFSERVIETQGDVVVGDHARIEFGVVTPGSAFLGDGVRVCGDLVAGGDVRVDLFTAIEGQVKADGSAFLGEGVH
ncbi:MAG: acyltransferase, partial [bacterium]